MSEWTDRDTDLLIEISKRIRGEAASVLLVAAKNAMLKAGIRRQGIEQVLLGMAKEADENFETLDKQTIQIAFEDLYKEESLG